MRKIADLNPMTPKPKRTFHLHPIYLYLIVTGLFLVLNLFDFYWLIKMSLTLAYGLSLLLIRFLTKTGRLTAFPQTPVKQNAQPRTYRQFARKRMNEIHRVKGHLSELLSPKAQVIRTTSFLVMFVVGVSLIAIGAFEYTGGPYLWSLFYWSLGFGLILSFVSFVLFQRGYESALRTGAILSGAFALSTPAIQRIVELYKTSLPGFMMALSLYLLILGVLLALWIRQILLSDTLAMMVYPRKDLWLGADLFFRDHLPIRNYDTMMVVQITFDDNFDLDDLMRLGSRLEAHGRFNRIPFVGLRFDPTQESLHLFYCTHKPTTAMRKLNLFFKRHFHYPVTISALQDPIEVFDRLLAPTDQEIQERHNANTVTHFEDEGIDLTEIHSVIFVLSFKDKAEQNQAQTDLVVAGYPTMSLSDARQFKDEPCSEWNGWFMIHLQIETRIGIDRINLLTRQLSDLLEPTDGVLSYWGLGTIKKTETLDPAE